MARTAEHTARIAEAIRKHGLSGTRIYRVWGNMIDRCHKPHHHAFGRYGGRGISVCARWRNDPRAFLADMGEPQPGMSIDRINNDGNYEPRNCRWASAAEQSRNRSNVKITPDTARQIRSRRAAGERIADIAASLGLNRNTVSGVATGWKWTSI